MDVLALVHLVLHGAGLSGDAPVTRRTARAVIASCGRDRGQAIPGYDGNSSFGTIVLTGKHSREKRRTMAQHPDKAVLAAITAAVTSYINTEERALMTAEDSRAVPPAPTAFGSLYGVYGRQQMMDMRRLVSLRLTRH